MCFVTVIHGVSLPQTRHVLVDCSPQVHRSLPPEVVLTLVTILFCFLALTFVEDSHG